MRVFPAQQTRTRVDATLAVSPASPSVDDELTFTGGGFTPGDGITVVVTSPYAVSWFGGPAEADGSYSSSEYGSYVALEAGGYKAEAYQSSDKKPDASVEFTVA